MSSYRIVSFLCLCYNVGVMRGNVLMGSIIKILVVEDEKMALEEMVHMLHSLLPTAEVFAYSNGITALEYAKQNPVDIAFLDVEMREIDGLTLAKKLIELYPRINVIFATGYDQYTKEALDMHVSGYILKPTTIKKIQRELRDLRHPLNLPRSSRVRIRTFGVFEVFIDNIPVHFKYSKTRELLAYLVDKRGTFCTLSEIMDALWGDESHTSYVKNLRGDLLARFKEKGVEDVLVKQRGKIAVLPEKLDCDYYRLLRDLDPVSCGYNGDYLESYPWGENTRSLLNKQFNNA